MSEGLSLKEKIQVWKATGFDVVISKSGIAELEASLDRTMLEVNGLLESAAKYRDEAKKYHKDADKAYTKVMALFALQLVIAAFSIWRVLS